MCCFVVCYRTGKEETSYFGDSVLAFYHLFGGCFNLTVWQRVAGGRRYEGRHQSRTSDVYHVVYCQ